MSRVSVTPKCRHYRGKQPTGYIAWQEWAELMSKTHDQILCPHCGRFAIWKLKPRGRRGAPDGRSVVSDAF